jgi:hypothetical protein
MQAVHPLFSNKVQVNKVPKEDRAGKREKWSFTHYIVEMLGVT